MGYAAVVIMGCCPKWLVLWILQLVCWPCGLCACCVWVCNISGHVVDLLASHWGIVNALHMGNNVAVQGTSRLCARFMFVFVSKWKGMGSRE